MIVQIVGALGAGGLALFVSVVVALAGRPLTAQWRGRMEIATLTQGSFGF